MNEKRFDVKQKYIPRSMILSNQPARFLGYKHRMNQVLNLCGRGEIRNKMSDLIKKGKCAKCNDYVSLGNENHITMLFIITMNAGRLSAIFAAMLIHPFEDGNGRGPQNIMMKLYIKQRQ